MEDAYQKLKAECEKEGIVVHEWELEGERIGYFTHIFVARDCWLNIPHDNAHWLVHRQQAVRLIGMVRKAVKDRENGWLSDDDLIELHQRSN